MYYIDSKLTEWARNNVFMTSTSISLLKEKGNNINDATKCTTVFKAKSRIYVLVYNEE